MINSSGKEDQLSSMFNDIIIHNIEMINLRYYCVDQKYQNCLYKIKMEKLEAKIIDFGIDFCINKIEDTKFNIYRFLFVMCLFYISLETGDYYTSMKIFQKKFLEALYQNKANILLLDTEKKLNTWNINNQINNLNQIKIKYEKEDRPDTTLISDLCLNFKIDFDLKKFIEDIFDKYKSSSHTQLQNNIFERIKFYTRYTDKSNKKIILYFIQLIYLFVF